MEDFLDHVQPTGIGITVEEVERNWILLDGPGKIRDLVVASTPAKYVHDSLVGREGYEHSWIFTLKAIETRKVERLLSAFEEYGNGEATDLAYVHTLSFKVVVHTFEGQAEPDLPLKGERVTCSFDWAVDKETGARVVDMAGLPILRCVAFQTQPAQAGSALKLRKMVRASDFPPVVLNGHTASAPA